MAKNSSGNEKAIIKPLAAAFLTTAPEQETEKSIEKFTAKTHTSSRSKAKLATKPPVETKSPGELTREETRDMLKEQLVTRMGAAKKSVDKSDNTEKKVAKSAVKKPAESKEAKEILKVSKPAEKKKAVAEKKEKTPVKDINSLPKTVIKAKDPEEAPAGKTGEIFIEYSGMSYSYEDIVRRAVMIWVRKLKRGRSNLKTLEIYVKPQERKVYYVFNKTRNGNFDL